MIALVETLAAGNALRLHLVPPAEAADWRVLRRADPDFAGPDDPGAAMVAEGRGADAVAVLDRRGLANGTAYHYRAYYRDATGAWLSEVGAGTGTPAATYAGDDVDPQTLVRERIEAGLAVEVARGALRPPPGKQRIQVHTAPFSLADAVAFPCVSVHLDSDAPAHQAVGEVVAGDEELPGEQGWTETDGWLSQVRLAIVGVSLNGDERIALRRALKRIVLANLPIFADEGLREVTFQQQDAEMRPDPTSTVVLYRTDGALTCIVPAFVRATVPEIREVAVAANPYGKEVINYD